MSVKIYLDNTDVTDKCKVNLEELEAGDGEIVPFYCYKKGGTVEYRVPKWVFQLLQNIAPDTFPHQNPPL